MLNTTFNNISVISWRSVLLLEETGVTGENHRPVTSYWQTLSHNVVSSIPRLGGFDLTTLVVIGTDCTGNINYHTITAPKFHSTPYRMWNNIVYIYYTFTHIRIIIRSISTSLVFITIWRFRKTMDPIVTFYITIWTRHYYKKQVEAWLINIVVK